MAGERIGILGGTFDPPHIGHLIVASDVWSALQLDRMLLVPAAVPPHKRGRVHASPEQRLEMVRAAVAGDPRFEADDIELRRAGASFTVDTLRELRGRYPGGVLFFVIGVDQLREFHTWREPEEVARLATLVVVAREGSGVQGDIPFPVRVVPVTRVDISATEIRRRARAGESIRYLVPEAVRTLVESRGLYSEPVADPRDSRADQAPRRR